MTITKLQLMRRLLLQLVSMIDAELRDRGAAPTIQAREYQQQQ